MYGTLSQAEATIARRTIEQIKPVKFEWTEPTPTGFIAQSTGQYLTNSNGGPTWSNPPAIGSYSAGSGLSIGQLVPNNSIQFNQAGKPVLIITNDGDVEWHGKPSEAADALQTVFQFKVEDMKGVTKAARRRYYWRAIDNLAKKSKQMSAEEFVDFVQKQAYSRECKVLINTLKGEPNVT